jgi:nitrogen regulatory protein PII
MGLVWCGGTERDGSQMNTLIIVARDSMLGELKDILHTSDIRAYTILHEVEGAGKTGTVYGTFLYPDVNAIMFAVLPPEHLDRVVDALKALLAARVKASPGQAIPLKVFSFPCEEHI